MSTVPTEKHIEQISKGLNEPSWLLDWRKEVYRMGQDLPQDVSSYGIGIFSKFPQVSTPSGNSQYVISSEAVQYIPWDALSSRDEVKKIIEGQFKKYVHVFSKNYVLNYVASLFTSGNVILVPENIDAGVVRVDTSVSGDISDCLVVIVQKNARAVIKEHVREGGSVYRTRHIFAQEGAHVDYIVANTEDRENLFSHSILSAERNAHISFGEVCTEGSFVKSNTEGFLAGEGARVDIQGVFFSHKECVQDILHTTTHLADNTSSCIQTAGVAVDSSKMVYRGLIDMKKNTKDLKGSQEGKFLVLSESAEVDAVPSLDIATKDVSCSHGVSISYLDEKDRFYPALRGISGIEAEELLVAGFLGGPVAEANQEVRTEVDSAIHTVLKKRYDE